MKPRPRIRKSIKWCGLLLSALLIAAWASSIISPRWWSSQTQTLYFLIPGTFWIYWSSDTLNEKVSASHELSEFRIQRALWFSFYDGPRGSWLTIPIAGPALLALLITATAWRLDTLARRHANKHLCTKCNYSRTGLAVGAVCPECGAAAPVGSLPPAKDI